MSGPSLPPSAPLITARPIPLMRGMGPICAALHVQSFPPADRWGAVSFEKLLRQPGNFGFVHPAGGMVLLRVVADEAEILTIAVRPEARRLGVGRILLEAGLLAAQTLGAGAMFLEVAPSNRAARALYQRLGFVAAGRRRGYYPNGDDALVLRRGLWNKLPDPAP